MEQSENNVKGNLWADAIFLRNPLSTLWERIRGEGFCPVPRVGAGIISLSDQSPPGASRADLPFSRGR
jgi:hypothetical protein